ncbi:MAG TPA: hypothetical protein VJL57_00150 [Candidatus Paceibacterota bacterium]
MINTNEHLASPDMSQPQEAAGTTEERFLSRVQATEMQRSRRSMLASIESDISTPFREVLERKVRYEYATLSALIEQEDHKATAKKKQRKVLHTQYFVQKRLARNFL